MNTSKQKNLSHRTRIKKKNVEGKSKEEMDQVDLSDENGSREEYLYDENEGTYVKIQPPEDDTIDWIEEDIEP